MALEQAGQQGRDPPALTDRMVLEKQRAPLLRWEAEGQSRCHVRSSLSAEDPAPALTFPVQDCGPPSRVCLVNLRGLEVTPVSWAVAAAGKMERWEGVSLSSCP